MDKIVKSMPLDDYKIEILTSSGISGVFDMKPYLEGSAFRELRIHRILKLVRPVHHGILWPHDQDLSSDIIVYGIQNA